MPLEEGGHAADSPNLKFSSKCLEVDDLPVGKFFELESDNATSSRTRRNGRKIRLIVASQTQVN
jgi:hypothetical protein